MARRSFEAYGLRVGLRANDPAALGSVLAMLPAIWKPSSGPLIERLFSLRVTAVGLATNGPPVHELSEDQQVVVSSADLDGILESLQRRLKMYIAEMAPRHTFVHAGTVGWQGKAIVIPGPSLSGKTSLVAALVRAGATYYSDEYAVLDERGRVHPYSAPLGLRQPGSYTQTRCRVEELGGQTGTKPLPVGLVVVTRYRPDARWCPRRLSAGRTTLELLANTVPARRKPATVIATLDRAVSGTVALKGPRGEAEETATYILDQLRRTATLARSERRPRTGELHGQRPEQRSASPGPARGSGGAGDAG
jgi:hypothetical protein